MTDFRTAINDALAAQGVEPGRYECYISAVIRNLEREENHRLVRLRSIASEYTDGGNRRRDPDQGWLRRRVSDEAAPKLRAPAGASTPGYPQDGANVLSDTELLVRIMHAVERVADAAEDIRDNH